MQDSVKGVVFNTIFRGKGGGGGGRRLPPREKIKRNMFPSLLFFQIKIQIIVQYTATLQFKVECSANY